MSGEKISVVGPVYNEEECVGPFYEALRSVFEGLGCDAEFIFVDDGSADRSLEILKDLRRRDPRVKIVSFSRNFGHQIAIKAGLDRASGDAVILMDTDLQDPPAVIPLFLEKWRAGFDVVYAVRESREGDSFFKKITAWVYYRLIRRLTRLSMPLDAGDFRLLAKPVAQVLRGIREKEPYLRGLVSWVGFRQTGVPIRRQKRLKGETKYPLAKMLRFAWSGVRHFSFVPLQLATFAGFLTAFFCFAWVLYTLYVALVLRVAVPGWASIMIAVLFLGSIQLITLGILGSYVAITFDETRDRPLYVVRETEGFEAARPAAAR